MKRHIPGLHQETKNASEFLKGYSWFAWIGLIIAGLASAEALFLHPLRDSRTAGTQLSLDRGAYLLHTESALETQLVPPRFRLRHRFARAG